MPLLLNRTDVLKLIKMDQVIEAVERVHTDLALGFASQPTRHSLSVQESSAVMIPMIATSSRSRLGCVKVLVDSPANARIGLPVQQSTIMLVNMDDGSCEAFVHGGAVTLYRTAAASAVATRALARPESRVLGIIGAGAQARTHLEAITSVCNIERVLVWSRTRRNAQLFADEANREGRHDVRVMDRPEDVVSGCDILCTLTPSFEPIVKGEWLREGQHINAVGAPPRVDHRELDTFAVQRSRVFVDSYDTALAESGDVMVPVLENAITVEHFKTELGQVLAGKRPGRTSSGEITFYNSVGVAIQDLAAAGVVLEEARSHGIGLDVSMTL